MIVTLNSDQQITSQRPEHLISKIKQKPSSKIEIAKVVLTRQPRAPDGTKGFSLTRSSIKSITAAMSAVTTYG